LENLQIVEYSRWVEFLSGKPVSVKEAYIPKIVREFGMPVSVVRNDLGLEENPKIKDKSAAFKEFIGFHDKPRIPTGYGPLDEAISGGLYPGQIVYLAGRTRTGKTTIALDLIYNLAQSGTPVLFLSLEMSAGRIYDRFVRRFYGLPVSNVQRIVKAGVAEQMFSELLEDKALSNIYIYDSGAVPADNIPIILAETEQRVGKKIGCVVIDYFELVKVYGKDAYNQAVEASKLLATFAKTHNVSLVVLHQCNRAAESQQITLAHIRNAGEEDADVVVGLWRPHIALEKNSDRFAIEARILKNRDGYETDFWIMVDTKTLSVSNVLKSLPEDYFGVSEQIEIENTSEEGRDTSDGFNYKESVF